MVAALLLSIQLIALLATFLLVTSAAKRWKQASASLSLMKRVTELEVSTQDLQSSFDSLLESHKRLRSRAGMRELRERRAGNTEPETKAQAWQRVFGGKSGPEAARRQLSMADADNQD